MSEEATTPQPVALARGDEGSIRIEWSDGRVTTWDRFAASTPVSLRDVS